MGMGCHIRSSNASVVSPGNVNNCCRSGCKSLLNGEMAALCRPNFAGVRTKNAAKFSAFAKAALERSIATMENAEEDFDRGSQ